MQRNADNFFGNNCQYFDETKKMLGKNGKGGKVGKGNGGDKGDPGKDVEFFRITTHDFDCAVP